MKRYISALILTWFVGFWLLATIEDESLDFNNEDQSFYSYPDPVIDLTDYLVEGDN